MKFYRLHTASQGPLHVLTAPLYTQEDDTTCTGPDRAFFSPSHKLSAMAHNAFGTGRYKGERTLYIGALTGTAHRRSNDPLQHGSPSLISDL